MEEQELEKQELKLPFDTTAAKKELAENIIQAEDSNALQAQLDLFNLAQRKKDALRVIKVNGVIDQIEDEVIRRFEKRPDQISNKELLDFWTVAANQLQRAQTSANTIGMPPIRITNPKTDITVNVTQTLDRDSKEKVADFVSNILKQIKQANNQPVNEPEIIDINDTDLLTDEEESDIEILDTQNIFEEENNDN